MAPTLHLEEVFDAVKQSLALLPTKTLPRTPSDVAIRQAPVATVTVTSDSGNNNDNSNQLSGGAIAGIVIGSVAGFLLLLWILRSCLDLGAPPQEQRESWYHDVEPDRVRESRRHSGDHHRHHHRHHSRSRPEMVAVEPVVVVDDRRRSRDRRSRSPRRPDNTYVYDSRRRSGRYYPSS